MARNKPRPRHGRGRSGQLTYWAPPEQSQPAAEMPVPQKQDPLHGYTLAEIHAIARRAASANKWRVSDFTIRYEHAWDAITEALLTTPARPSPHDLAAIGKGAVSRDLLKDFCHTYGVADRDLSAGMGSAPRFAAYWFRPPAQPMDEAITERIALGQVLAALTAKDAAILQALAAAGDNRAAAAALGMPRSSFSAYASWARDAFERLWYDHEPPPQQRRKPHRYAPSERNISRRAPCGTPGAYLRHKKNGEEIDEDCRLAYSLHESERKRNSRRKKANTA